jgi:hypothetical protein
MGRPIGPTLCTMLKRIAASALVVVALSARAEPKDALESESLGLAAGADYRLADGRCTDCPASRQALWYFQDDVVAVPRNAGDGRPSLVWVGSPEIVEHAVLSADGTQLTTTDGAAAPLTLTPKLATNRSYFDASTAAFFQHRALRIRGRHAGGAFVARAIWPEDYRLERARATTAPPEAVDALVTADDGGARAPYATRVLWERNPAAPGTWAGKPALAFVLSGAQGDDDEAHGGHFAIATGRVGPGGEWSDWLVNNFYNLDSVSEKGIIAARVPMDAYLADLNSGQAYYRPAYVLALVLRSDRAAVRYQAQVDRAYEALYRHDMPYHHSASNCTGISMDALRGIGWQVPRRGPTSYAKATAAFFYRTATTGSVEKGESTFDYLVEEQTRLLPRVAFDEAGADVVRLLRGERAAATEYERQLKQDVEAVVFVRVPQIPSSRAFGTFPVGSFAEYQARVPADVKQWKIVSVAPRPFPSELREGPAPAPHRSKAVPAAASTSAAALGATWWLARGMRRLQRRRADRAAAAVHPA